MSRIQRAALGAVANLMPLTTLSPGPARRYRRSVRVTIPTGGVAQRMNVLPDTVMHVSFSGRQFNAKEPTALEAAALTSGSNGLVLKLPVARRIARISLASTQAGDQVAAFRFDGPVVSDDAVAVATHQADGAHLDVTDSQLILRRRRGGSDLALAPGDIASVVIAVEPAQPRIAFAIVGDPEGEIALPPDTDASGAPVFPNAGAFGPRLAAALTTQLGRFGSSQPTLPDPLLLDLILEADTPCSAGIDSFDLGYELTRSGFSDGADKRVLRFAAGRGDAQAVPIDLPPGIHVLSAELRLTLAGAAAPSAQRRAAVVTGAALPATAAQGIAISPEHLAAVRLALGSATVVTGVDLLVGAIETPAEITVSLWDDANGLPGTPLDESAPVSLTSGRPVAVAVTFSPAITVPAGDVWLVISVGRGRAVLGLVAAAAGGVATGDGTTWSMLKAADGLTVAVRLRSPVSAEEGAVVEDGPSVALGSLVLAGSRDGRAHSFEFSGHLNALAEPRPSQVALTVQADAGGVVTVEPPVLRYVID